MQQNEFRQAVLALAWAAAPKAVVEILKSLPYLQSPAVDELLTREIQAPGTPQERAAFLGVRSFLKDLREERHVGTALQRAGCLPLALSCPVQELIFRAGKMDPLEQEKMAQKLLRQVRPESELMLYALAKYLLGQAIYHQAGAQREPELRRAAQAVQDVIDATREQPALREVWKEAYQLLSHVWEDIAKADLPNNAEEVIQLYEAALQGENWVDAGSEKARLLHTQGYLNSMRPTVDRYASIETGIRQMEESLKALGDDHPRQSALSWNDLGNAYVERVAGEPFENFHQALAYYELARKAHESSHEPDPKADQRLAEVEYNASVACRVLAQFIYAEDEADQCIAAGIAHAQMAGKFYRSENNLRMLAKIQSEIGKLHYYHRGKRAEHIPQAIAYLEAALVKIDRQLEPVHWGNTQDSLANAYSESEQGQRLKNLGKAIEHYYQALEIFHLDDYPQHWANIQNNLGATYADLGRTGLARERYQAAFQVRKANRLPDDTRQTAFNLGNLEFFQKNWGFADQAYSIALDASERLYQASYTEAGKKTEQSKRFLLTQRAAYAAVMKDIARGRERAPWWKNGGARALLILEKNKTRLLSERMQTWDARPEKVPEKVWNNYQRAAGRVRTARLPEANLEQHAATFTKEMAASKADMENLHAQLEAVRAFKPDFLDEIDADDLRSLISDS